MTSGVEARLENRAESAPSPATPNKYLHTKVGGYHKYKEYGGDGSYEGNNDIKGIASATKGMMLGGSPAELAYYKHLLVANVADLGKAAKMGFNTTNLYSSARGGEEKRPCTPEDETGSVSSNDEPEPNENENSPGAVMNQVMIWRRLWWCRHRAALPYVKRYLVF